MSDFFSEDEKYRVIRPEDDAALAQKNSSASKCAAIARHMVEMDIWE